MSLITLTLLAALAAVLVLLFAIAWGAAQGYEDDEESYYETQKKNRK